MKLLLLAVVLGIILFSGCTAQNPTTPLVSNLSQTNSSNMSSFSQIPVLTIVQNPTLGQILADNQTVYVFLNDKINQSNCYGQCSDIWPPVPYLPGDNLSGLPGVINYINRTDGSEQLTYNGMPLYYYISDSYYSDANGQGVGGVWFTINPNSNSFPINKSQAVLIARNSNCSLAGAVSNNSFFDTTANAWTVNLTNSSYPNCISLCTVYLNQSTEIDQVCTQSNINTSANPPVIKPYSISSVVGPIVSNNQNRTVYVFIQDKINQSTCMGSCQQTWPPVILTSNLSLNFTDLPGTLGLITRPDGSKQVTYNGMPLYIYSGDPSPGFANGNGVNNQWFVLTPSTTTFPSPPPVRPAYGGGGY